MMKIIKQENIPAPDEQKKSEHKKQFLEMVEKQNFEMSDMQFLIGQFRFIKKRTWLFQLVVLAAAICYMKINSVNYESSGKYLTMFATLTPFLLISQIEEMVKVYTNSMIEIELSTKNSLSKLITARMSILGMVDMIVLLIWLGFCAGQMNESLWDIGFSYYMILYGLVPYNVTLICYLALLTYAKKEYFAISAFMTTVSIVLIYYRMCIRNNYIYSNEYTEIWVAAYVLSLVGFAFIVYKHKKKIQIYEVVYEH